MINVELKTCYDEASKNVIDYFTFETVEEAIKEMKLFSEHRNQMVGMRKVKNFLVTLKNESNNTIKQYVISYE